MKALGIAAYLSFVIERLSQALQVRPHPVPAQIRPLGSLRPQVWLEVAYHPAKAQEGYVFIPRDQYFRDSEALLERL